MQTAASIPDGTTITEVITVSRSKIQGGTQHNSNTVTFTVDRRSMITPVAVADSFSTDEDTTSAAIDLIGNDTDVDGDTLTVQSIAGTAITPGTAQTIAVSNGTVNVSAAGVVTFTPDANYNGPIAFSYVVSDGQGGTDTGSVSGTINPVNDNPVAVADSFSTDEDTTSAAIDLIGNDTDVDGDTLSIQSIAGTAITPGTAQTIAVSNGTVNVSAAGVVTFTPDANYNGPIAFTYVVSDGQGGTDTGSVSGTINPINDDPVAVTDSFSTDEDTTSAAIDLIGNDTDVDGDTLSVQSIAGTAITPGTAQTIAVSNGTVNVSAAGVVTFTPDANYNGPIAFTYVVSDGQGGSDTGSVSGTINPINDDPTAVADSFSTDEDTTSAAIDLIGNDTDVDGDTLSVQSIAGTAITPGTAQTIAVTNGTVNVSAAGVVTFTPDANYNGPIAFTYVVSDGQGGSDTGSVSGTINPINDDPTAVADSYSTDEDTPLNIPANGVLGNDSDVDGDTLTVQSHTAASNGTVVVNGDGSFSYTPNADFNGTDTFTYTVTDSNGGTATATVTITVDPVNDNPVAVADSFSTDEDTTSAAIDLIGNDTDVDGDTLSVQSIAGTAITPGTAQTIAVTNGTVNVSAAGVVTFTPDANYNGPIAFTYVVSDGQGGTDTGSVSGTINPITMIQLRSRIHTAPMKIRR